jgi:hypothetical protein
VALALRDVLPPVDVHRASPLEAGRPVRHQVVEPKVAHLQQRDLVDPHDHSSQAQCAANVSGRHAGNQRTVAFRMGSFSATGRPRIEPSILDQDENWLT